MLYPLFTQEFIHCIVLELGAIVTSNCLDLTVMLTLSFFGKVDEGFLSFIFSLEEENPSISCEVINNDKAIPPPSQTIICWRSKQIQMNKLKGPQGGEDSLHFMSFFMNLSGNASTTRMIFGKRHIG